MKFFNGILETPDEAIARHRRHRRPAQPHELSVGLGAVRQHAVQVVQAEHPRGRRARAADRALAGGHRRSAARDPRDQFVNVTDIAPTIYEPARRHAARRCSAASSSSRSPATRSLTSLADPAAPATNTLQYFEMAGQPRRSSPDGGRRCASTSRVPTTTTEPWELYHLDVDASECHDLADAAARASSPSWSSCGGSEAERHGVLPLDDRAHRAVRRALPRPLAAPVDRRYVYRPPMSPLPAQASAAIGGRSFDLTARDHPGARRRGSPVRDRHGELGHLACSSRTIGWSSTTTRSTTTPSSRVDVTVPTGDSVLDGAVPPRRGPQRHGRAGGRRRRLRRGRAGACSCG